MRSTSLFKKAARDLFRLGVALTLALASVSAGILWLDSKIVTVDAQQTTNPINGIRWPLITGAGAPTMTCQPTSPPPSGSSSLGQPYVDTNTGLSYVCSGVGTSGWTLTGIPPLSGTGAPTATCSLTVNYLGFYTDYATGTLYQCVGPTTPVWITVGGGGGGGATLPTNALVWGVTPTTSRVATEADLGPLAFSVATGTINNPIIAITPAPASLTPNSTYVFYPNITNSSSVMLQVNSFSPQFIVKNGNVALTAGDLLANWLAVVKWDGNNFELQNPQSPVINLANGIIQGTGTGAGNSAATAGQLATPLFGGTSTGAGATYALNLSPAITSYTQNLTLTFFPNAANTLTAPTLNVNGLGPVTITKNGTAALSVNDLTTTALATVKFDGTSFQLQNPQTNVGTNGTNGFASAAQLALLRSKLPITSNLFNSATVTTGNYINGSTGNLVVNASFNASDYIACNSGAQMVTSASIANGTVGYAFYDATAPTPVYISGSNTAVGAGGNITCPSTAVYVRISIANGSVTNEFFGIGTSLPSLPPSFQPLDTLNAALLNLATYNQAITTHAPIINGFDSTATTVGALTTTGTINSGITADVVSDYIPVAGLPQFVLNVACTNGGGFACGWFDARKNFISAIATTTSGTAITPIATAGYIRVYFASNLAATAMLNNGGTVSSTYIPFSNSTNIASIASSTAQVLLTNLQQQKLGPYANLYNYQSPTLIVGALKSTNGQIDTTITADVVSDFMNVDGLASIVSNYAIPNSGGFAWCWYDANQNFISAIAATAAGTAVTKPAGAKYIRIFSTAYVGATIGNVPVEVIAGPTLPAGYVAFYTIPRSISQHLINGCAIAFWGDSITATYGQWENELLMRTGCSRGFQDAVNGRGTQNALSNALGGTGGHYSNNTTTGVNGGGNTGTPGNTLTQDMTAQTTMVMWEGTDDCTVFGSNPGSPSSTAWDGSEYGNIRGLIETLQAANPSSRLFWVGPYYQALTTCSDGPTLPGIRAAILSETQSHGIPFLDMMTQSGINAQNLAVTLQSDQIHPLTAYSQAVLGPMIAEFINRYK